MNGLTIMPVLSGNQLSLPKQLLTAILGISFLGLCEIASADPAVADVNGKLNFSGGSYDGKGAGIGSGSFTVPLAQSFGLQFDGGAGSINGNAYWSGGSHLFWRYPGIGLLGVAYSYQRWNDFDFGFLNNSSTSVVKDAFMHRAGAEGELYLSRFTLSGRGGYQDGTVKADGYGQLKLRYYATDDLAIHVAGDHFAGLNAIRGGFEYRPNLAVFSGLSFFAEGGYGSHDYAMGSAGVRFYFGNSTNLINRDRRSDPESLVPEETSLFIQQVQTPAKPAPVQAPASTPEQAPTPTPEQATAPVPAHILVQTLNPRLNPNLMLHGRFGGGF